LRQIKWSSCASHASIPLSSPSSKPLSMDMDSSSRLTGCFLPFLADLRPGILKFSSLYFSSVLPFCLVFFSCLYVADYEKSWCF
jgi:hypothetical protein